MTKVLLSRVREPDPDLMRESEPEPLEMTPVTTVEPEPLKVRVLEPVEIPLLRSPARVRRLGTALLVAVNDWAPSVVPRVREASMS